jgi:hypothetical protein
MRRLLDSAGVGTAPPGVRHRVQHGFLRHPHAVAIPKLLAGQRRPEIGVALTDDGKCTVERTGNPAYTAAREAPTAAPSASANRPRSSITKATKKAPVFLIRPYFKIAIKH